METKSLRLLLIIWNSIEINKCQIYLSICFKWIRLLHCNKLSRALCLHSIYTIVATQHFWRDNFPSQNIGSLHGNMWPHLSTRLWNAVTIASRIVGWHDVVRAIKVDKWFHDVIDYFLQSSDTFCSTQIYFYHWKLNPYQTH